MYIISKSRRIHLAHIFPKIVSTEAGACHIIRSASLLRVFHGHVFVPGCHAGSEELRRVNSSGECEISPSSLHRIKRGNKYYSSLMQTRSSHRGRVIQRNILPRITVFCAERCSSKEENSLRRCRTAPWCDTAQNYDACPAGYIGSRPSALALVFLRVDKLLKPEP